MDWVRYAQISCVCGEKGAVLSWSIYDRKPVRCPSCGKGEEFLKLRDAVDKADSELFIWDGNKCIL